MASVAQFASLTSSVTNANTAYADVTGLSAYLPANTNWRFKAGIHFTTNAITTGSAFSMNGPASPTLFVCRAVVPLTATTNSYMHTTAYDTNAANATSLATDNYAELEGIIRNGATSGSFTVRFISEVAVGLAVVANIGSWLEVRPV